MSLFASWRSRAGAIAAALIALQTAWRGAIEWRGFFTQDDYLMLQLGAGRLQELFFYDYAGHWFPGGFLIAWAQAHVSPLNWQVAAGLVIVWQLLAAAMMWLVLTRIAPRSWWRLPALAVMLFTPMSLWSTQWWAVAIQFLPVTFFLLLAVWAFLVDVLDGPRMWTQLVVVFSVAAGLTFQERALMIPIVLAFVAVALTQPTNLRRGVFAALWRNRWLWGVLALLNLGYLAIHRSVAPISAGEPGSVSAPKLIFNYVVRLFLPTAWGGPWTAQVPGESALVPPTWVVVISLVASLALVAVTVKRGGWCTRWGWALLGCYLLLDVALLFAGRTSLGEVIGLVPRYVADVAPVLAISLGLVARDHATLPGARSRAVALGVACGYVLSAAISTSWMAGYYFNESDRAYVSTLRAQLRENPQAVLFDAVAPDSVMIQWFGDDGRVSTVAGSVPEAPLFDLPSYDLRYADAYGFLRKIDLLGGTSMEPSSDTSCGYPIGTSPVQIKLQESIDLNERGVLRIGYYTSAEGTLEVTTGSVTQQVTLRQELSIVDFVVQGSFDEVTVRADIEDSGVCITNLDVGSPWPRAEE